MTDEAMPTRAAAIAAVDEYFKRTLTQEDDDGELAVHMGARCYNQAMEMQDAQLHEARIAFFQAAEYLYRIAQSKGNLWGYVDAGYIYYYDRCEGCYVPDFREVLPSEQATMALLGEFDLDSHAYECFRYGAEHGEPQSAYKIGDMHKYGRGCEIDYTEAFRMYERAYEWGLHDDPVCWGGAALRLGGCYEEGLGVEQDFEQALAWYEKAEIGLNIAVSSGGWFFERSLQGAKDGILRCRQELDGSY